MLLILVGLKEGASEYLQDISEKRDKEIGSANRLVYGRVAADGWSDGYSFTGWSPPEHVSASPTISQCAAEPTK